MKPGGGQKKGKKYEKDLAKKLSLWWTDGERDDIFYLSSGSGSRFTTRQKLNKSTANSAGDLNALDPIGQPLVDLFVLEAKKGYNKELDILKIIDSKKKTHALIDWLSKSKKEARESGRYHALVLFRRDNHQDSIAMEYMFFARLEPFCGGFQETYLEINLSNLDSYAIMKLDHFLEWCDREDIEGMLKHLNSL